MAKFDPSRPYNELPKLPPKADIETRGILKACIDARAAVAALRQAGTLIPNQGVLINTIPLLEAQASSEIENIVTTTDALFKYAQIDSEKADPTTKEALRYRTALRLGVESLKMKPLGTSTAVGVCSTIKGRQMEIRRVPGTALTNPAKNAVIYTPPAGEALLRKKLANWERFIHEQTEVDPLIRMAVAHYQFEAIHPFTDGNGRTGRVLNQLMLVEQGLLDLPVLYLSRYIIGNKADYYRLLLAVTRDAPWENPFNAIRTCAGPKDLQPRAGRADFRAAVLPHPEHSRRAIGEQADGIRLSEGADRYRNSQRSQSRP